MSCCPRFAEALKHQNTLLSHSICPAEWSSPVASSMYKLSKARSNMLAWRCEAWY